MKLFSVLRARTNTSIILFLFYFHVDTLDFIPVLFLSKFIYLDHILVAGM